MMSRIAVCICTYRRPEGLEACLSALEKQSGPAFEVVVVENEADGPGRAICQRHPGLTLTYAAEPRSGIPWARNACLELAAGWADLIAFIDDDEVPEPDWLKQLAATQQGTGADIVCGPAFPIYRAPVPRWLRRGRFHHPPKTETGHQPAFCATNNVLFRAELVRRLDLRFDPRLVGMGVGEDVLFFTRATEAGARAVWCAEAIVWESVPAERMTASWLICRAYRIGICDSVAVRARLPALPGTAASLCAGLGRVAAHAALLPLSLARGRRGAVRRLRGLSYGLGRLAGLGFQGARQ